MNRLTINHSKAGEDFAKCSKKTNGDVIASLKMHADLLRSDADTLIRVASLIECMPEKNREQIAINGDIHNINIKKCPKQLLDMLKRMNLIGEDKPTAKGD